MRLLAFIIAFAWALPFANGGHAADFTVSTGRMSSGLNDTLPINQRVYVEVKYSSIAPLRFQARAFANGASVDQGQMMNASVPHPPGTGAALAWVGFHKAASVDQIRVAIYDADWKLLRVIPLKATLRWAGSGPVKEPPSWARVLQAEQDRIAASRQQEYDDSDASLFGSLIGLIIMAGVPGYFVLQFIAANTLRGPWRFASFAPLIVMVPVTGHALLALAAGSNLWPILVIFCAPVALLYLLGLYAVRSMAAA